MMYKLCCRKKKQNTCTCCNNKSLVSLLDKIINNKCKKIEKKEDIIEEVTIETEVTVEKKILNEITKKEDEIDEPEGSNGKKSEKGSNNKKDEE